MNFEGEERTEGEKVPVSLPLAPWPQNVGSEAGGQATFTVITHLSTGKNISATKHNEQSTNNVSPIQL